jgi:hypothetical protein
MSVMDATVMNFEKVVRVSAGAFVLDCEASW